MKGRRPNPSGKVVPLKGDMPARTPDAPEFMSDEARKVWDELAPLLAQQGRLKPEFVYQFATYCESAGNFIAATHCLQMEEGGRLYYETETRNGKQQKKVAAWAIQQEAMAAMLRIGGLFGLTPVDEARLKSEGQGDLFDDFIAAVKGKGGA